MRTAIAVIVGFVVWTALRFGAVGALYSAFPGGFDEAGAPTTAIVSWLVLLSTLPVSIVAGWVCARIGRPRGVRAAVILTGVQIAIGAAVQSGYLDVLPWWWHALFLAQLPLGILLGAFLSEGRRGAAAGRAT